MKLKLITKKELKAIDKGTVLYCISEEKVIVGTDYIDDDTRGGYLAYGFKLPDDAQEFDWDTKSWTTQTKDAK